MLTFIPTQVKIPSNIIFWIIYRNFEITSYIMPLKRAHSLRIAEHGSWSMGKPRQPHGCSLGKMNSSGTALISAAWDFPEKYRTTSTPHASVHGITLKKQIPMNYTTVYVITLNHSGSPHYSRRILNLKSETTLPNGFSQSKYRSTCPSPEKTM